MSKTTMPIAFLLFLQVSLRPSVAWNTLDRRKQLIYVSMCRQLFGSNTCIKICLQSLFRKSQASASVLVRSNSPILIMDVYGKEHHRHKWLWTIICPLILYGVVDNKCRWPINGFWPGIFAASYLGNGNQILIELAQIDSGKVAGQGGTRIKF